MTTDAQNAATGLPPENADVETSSDGYANRFSGPVGAWFLEVQAGIVLGMLPPPPQSVLDVGGGHGQLAAPLVAAGYDVTVLGSDASCARRIRDLLETGRCRFATGSLTDLPFEDRSFDCVLSFRLLTHCARWERLVAELARVARNRVIVDYPTSRSVNKAAPFLFRAKRSMEGNTRVWRDFTHAEVAGAFRRHGFTVPARRGQYVLPMVLHRAMRCRSLSRILEGMFRAAGITRLLGSPVILCAESAR